MKKIDNKRTFKYAVAFLYSGYVQFRMGEKIYQFVNTVYDRRNDSDDYNTIAVCYDYKAMKYVAFNISDPKIGNKEVDTIG